MTVKEMGPASVTELAFPLGDNHHARQGAFPLLLLSFPLHPFRRTLVQHGASVHFDNLTGW